MKPTSIQDMKPFRLIRKRLVPLPLNNNISASIIVADSILKNATGAAATPKFESRVANNPIVPHKDPAANTIK